MDRQRQRPAGTRPCTCSKQPDDHQKQGGGNTERAGSTPAFGCMTNAAGALDRGGPHQFRYGGIPWRPPLAGSPACLLDAGSSYLSTATAPRAAWPRCRIRTRCTGRSPCIPTVGLLRTRSSAPMRRLLLGQPHSSPWRHKSYTIETTSAAYAPSDLGGLPDWRQRDPVAGPQRRQDVAAVGASAPWRPTTLSTASSPRWRAPLRRRNMAPTIARGPSPWPVPTAATADQTGQ